MSGRALALLAVGLVAAACGGQDPGAEGPPASTSAPPLAAPPPSGFIASAESICASMDDAASAVTGGSKPTDDEALELVRTWRAALDELETIDPPVDVRPDVARMIAAYRNTARALETLVTVNDETVLAAAAGIAVFGQRGSRAAREAGLDRCAFFPAIEQPGPDPQGMYDATRELVPPGATVLFEDEAACGDEGSCRFEFETEGPVGVRMDAMRRIVRANGWSNVREGRSQPATTWLMASRNDYALTVELVGRPLPEHCGRSDLSWGCVDSVWVHRIDVPDVLTGG